MRNRTGGHVSTHAYDLLTAVLLEVSVTNLPPAAGAAPGRPRQGQGLLPDQCGGAVMAPGSSAQLASSVPKERRKTLEAALSEVNAWGFDVWSVVDAFQGCVEINFRAPHAIDAMLTHW